MQQNLDMRQVAGFALGRYARGANPAQRDRYVAVYSDYVARIYANRFSEYGGETITVTGAQDVGRKGFFVNSTVNFCLLYTSPSPRDATLSRMPSSA